MDKGIVLFLKVSASAFYIGLKYAIFPVILIPYLFGSKNYWIRKIDERIGRLILPNTEGVDTLVKVDVALSKEKDVRTLFPELNVSAMDKHLLVFYRGEWCPYSRKHLSHIIESLDFIKSKGIDVWLIHSFANNEELRELGIYQIVDSEGQRIQELELRNNSLFELAWGRRLPYETTLLVDHRGVIINADVRKVSGIKLHQKVSPVNQLI